MSATFDTSKLKVNLEALRACVANDGKRKAVVAGAKVIAAAFVERAPVLAEKQPGSDSLEPREMLESVKVRSKLEDGEPIALVGPTGRAAKTAHLVEYGHRMVTGGKSRLDASGTFVGGGEEHELDVPAYPWLRPGFEASASAALETVGITLGKEIVEAVK